MKLTKAANYALHAVAYMASQRVDQPLASNKIAEERGIPARFLLKVLKNLVEAGLLLSVKGPSGGYQLARAASEISMLDVVKAVDGPIEGVAPPLKKDDLTSLSARVDEVCREVSDNAARVLGRVRISQLVGKLRLTNGTNGKAESHEDE